jgi:hypothetical protein
VPVGCDSSFRLFELSLGGKRGVKLQHGLGPVRRQGSRHAERLLGLGGLFLWALEHLPRACVRDRSVRIDPAAAGTDGFFVVSWVEPR